MKHKFISVIGPAVLMLGTAAGCVDGNPDESIAEFRSALTNTNGLAANGLAANGLAANGLAANGLAANGLAANGLAANGLAANGLAANGLAANGLAANGLAANGLAANGLAANGLAANGMPVSVGVAAGLHDEASRVLFRYIVSCALPEGVTLTFSSGGVTHAFTGEIGLAPEWLTSGCDQSCQRWVSACLIARTNFRGEHVEISIRGAHAALKVEPDEQRSFDVREAAYYGNLFQERPALYGCLPQGSTAMDRVCGPSLEGCVVRTTGECETVCAGPGRNRSYRSCRSGDALTSEQFAETITVFRRR